MMNVFEKIREKLEELCEQTYYNSVNGNRDEGIRNNAYHNTIEIVNKVEQEHNNGWIPCSERLPKEDERVLCFHSHCFIDCGVLVGEVWCCDMDEYAIKRDNVIAWQPLPQPYKERDTNGN